MKLVDKIKVFKNNISYPDMLFSYPSWYVMNNNKDILKISNISWNENLLYIHIPFCIKICSFCNVHKTKYINIDQIENYLDVLFKEIDYFSEKLDWEIKWIYIWWWTPTILPDELLEDLFIKINEKFNISTNCNIEIDAHPTTLTESKLAILAKYWVSQITMWIQSMQEDVLDNIWRLKHSYVFLEKLSRIIKKYSFKLHFDFVLWLPWDNNLNDIEKSISFICTEFSPYSLSINSYDNTVDTELYQNNIFNFNDKKYKEKLHKDMSHISNFVKINYNIERRKTFYFSNFFRNHHNVIWIWAGSYWFIRWQWVYKNNDYIDYIKEWGVNQKKGIKSNIFDEKIMYILHNNESIDLNANYYWLFWTRIIDNYFEKIQYFIWKWLVKLDWDNVIFNFKSKNIARFELINLYSSSILKLYK